MKRRFEKHRGYDEEEIIDGSAEKSRRRLLQVKRAKHSVGETWLLRKELRQCYRLIDEESELCDLDTDVLVKGKKLLEVTRKNNIQNIPNMYFV